MKLIHLFVAAFIFFVAVETHAGECQEYAWDVWKVAKALQQGISKETLLDHLEGSRGELTPERMERIRGLIDEVYKLEQSEAQVWWQAHRKECPKESET